METKAERPLILPPLRRNWFAARTVAETLHRGQKDKAGRPYMGHITRVHDRLVDLLEGLPNDQWDEARQIAWLHDVIEDTPYDEDDLRREGFGPEVVKGVEMLSWPGTSYLSWIDWLAAHAPLPVILVKIADIEDNSDPERLALLDEPTRERLKKKYGAALPILKHAAARMRWRQGTLPAAPEPA